MSRSTVALVVGLALARAAVADAVVFQFCVRKNTATGGVKDGARAALRATCKANEVALPVAFDETGKTVRVTGANLQVTSGAGATDGTVNGLGNLIVGYN